MRFVMKQQPDGLWLVKDEWTNKVLAWDLSREYAEGFLAGAALMREFV